MDDLHRARIGRNGHVVAVGEEMICRGVAGVGEHAAARIAGLVKIDPAPDVARRAPLPRLRRRERPFRAVDVAAPVGRIDRDHERRRIAEVISQHRAFGMADEDQLLAGFQVGRNAGANACLLKHRVGAADGVEVDCARRVDVEPTRELVDRLNKAEAVTGVAGVCGHSVPPNVMDLSTSAMRASSAAQPS